MDSSPNDNLFEMIAMLQKANIFYTLQETREDAVTIVAVVPGERWEIDVYRDGEINTEVFRSNGEILDKRQLRELIQRFTER